MLPAKPAASKSQAASSTDPISQVTDFFSELMSSEAKPVARGFAELPQKPVERGFAELHKKPVESGSTPAPTPPGYTAFKQAKAPDYFNDAISQSAATVESQPAASTPAQDTTHVEPQPAASTPAQDTTHVEPQQAASTSAQNTTRVTFGSVSYSARRTEGCAPSASLQEYMQQDEDLLNKYRSKVYSSRP